MGLKGVPRKEVGDGREDQDGKAPGASFAVSDKTGADARGLPPGATLLYIFEGLSKE